MAEPDATDTKQAIDWAILRLAAVAASKAAYAPYSNFSVGAAALVDDGRIVTGCNVENVSYGLSLCAECGLVSDLHSTGGGRILAVSVVSSSGDACTPCGRCRQLLLEHGGPDCLVDAGPSDVAGPALSVAELLPGGFDQDRLDQG